MKDGRVAIRPTVLKNSSTYVVTAWAACLLVGAGVGWALRAVSEWAVTVDGLPMKDWITVLAKVPNPVGTILCVLLGAALGGWIARLVLKGSVALLVTTTHVVWHAGGAKRRIAREEISAIYLDGVDDLVFLGSDTGELARANNNLDEDTVKEVLLRYEYPYFDADPHLDEFSRWVEDLPELTPTMNALLKARQKALEENKPTEDAAELRTELGKLGVVVRQNDDRQFYRLVRPASVASA